MKEADVIPKNLVGTTRKLSSKTLGGVVVWLGLMILGLAPLVLIENPLDNLAGSRVNQFRWIQPKIV